MLKMLRLTSSEKMILEKGEKSYFSCFFFWFLIGLFHGMNKMHMKERGVGTNSD